MTDPARPPTQPAPTTVLICDERPHARRELTALLTSGAIPFHVTATQDAAGMIEQFGHAPADVVMIGVHHGNGIGFTSMTLLLDPHPSARVVVYGQAQDSVLLTSAVAGGARGVMIWDTVHRPYPVRSTGAHQPGSSAGQVKTATSLTERELQVLTGMSQGRSNGAIGRELYLSEDTVKTHARRLFTKIGAADRAHAVALGLRTGLLQPNPPC